MHSQDDEASVSGTTSIKYTVGRGTSQFFKKIRFCLITTKQGHGLRLLPRDKTRPCPVGLWFILVLPLECLADDVFLAVLPGTRGGGRPTSE